MCVCVCVCVCEICSKKQNCKLNCLPYSLFCFVLFCFVFLGVYTIDIEAMKEIQEKKNVFQRHSDTNYNFERFNVNHAISQAKQAKANKKPSLYWVSLCFYFLFFNFNFVFGYYFDCQKKQKQKKYVCCV